MRTAGRRQNCDDKESRKSVAKVLDQKVKPYFLRLTLVYSGMGNGWEAGEKESEILSATSSEVDMDTLPVLVRRTALT